MVPMGPDVPRFGVVREVAAVSIVWRDVKPRINHKQFRSQSGEDSEENLMTTCTYYRVVLHGGNWVPGQYCSLPVIEQMFRYSNEGEKSVRPRLRTQPLLVNGQAHTLLRPNCRASEEQYAAGSLAKPVVEREDSWVDDVSESILRDIARIPPS